MADEDVPAQSPADALGFIEKQVEEYGLLDQSDALHLFYGVTFAIVSLHAEPVNEALRARDARYAELGDGRDWTELFGSTEAAVDWIGDIARTGKQLLGEWLAEHDLDVVELVVYLPCHRSFAIQKFEAVR